MAVFMKIHHNEDDVVVDKKPFWVIRQATQGSQGGPGRIWGWNFDFTKIRAEFRWVTGGVRHFSETPETDVYVAIDGSCVKIIISFRRLSLGLASQIRRPAWGR